MTDHARLARHYAHGSLLDAIAAGVAKLGKTPETITAEALAPVDEFHIGGREASADFLGQIGLRSGMRVLDIGCGLGGTARFAAGRFGVHVTGIDLTAEYVEVGRELCRWVGLDAQIELHRGSALELPFDAAAFDAAYMIHVGMNIADKAALCRAVARVLRPGAVFGIFDIMRTGDGDLAFPVPWASVAEESAVATPAAYRRALESAGLVLTAERNRHDFAVEYFARFGAELAKAGGPPPLGTHILTGAAAKAKYVNLVENIRTGRVAPVEMMARKDG